MNLLDQLRDIYNTEGPEAARQWRASLSPQDAKRLEGLAVLDWRILDYMCERPQRVMNWRLN